MSSSAQELYLIEGVGDSKSKASTLLCMVPLGSCARSLQSYNASTAPLGSCVRDPATASTSSTMPACVPSGVVLAVHGGLLCCKFNLVSCRS